MLFSIKSVIVSNKEVSHGHEVGREEDGDHRRPPPRAVGGRPLGGHHGPAPLTIHVVRGGLEARERKQQLGPPTKFLYSRA